MLSTERADKKWVAASQVLAGALFFSAVPVIVRYAAPGINPFMLNAANWAGHGVAFLLFVMMSTKRIFGQDATMRSVLSETLPPRSSVSVRSVFVHLCRIEGQRSSTGNRQSADAATSWLRKPMTWMVIASLNYALFFWSTRHVDVAVSTAIYELWPLALVLVLARYDDPRIRAARREVNSKKKLLMGVAFVGLALVILGQSDVTSDALADFLPLGISGVLLALLSALLAGVYPALSIVFGDALHFEYSKRRIGSPVKTDDPSGTSDAVPIVDGTHFDKRENLWFTAVGVAMSSLLAVPVDIALSVVGSGVGALELGNEMLTGLLYGFLLGSIVVAGGTFFLRLANLNSDDLGINAIFYITPVLALTWLAVAGIALPRLDLFLMGAGLVLSINVIIQSSPDADPEFARADVEPPSSGRLGFTSLVLAIWFFGGFIYLRDEMLPTAWLNWSQPEYWAVVALSATVFALIFGFRVARLTSRLALEDEITIRLFRRAEQLLAANDSRDDTLAALRRLDTASAANLPGRYARVRRHFLSAREEFEASGDGTPGAATASADFVQLEEDLDRLAHSKQQGRDFSELISVVLIALITVVLGTVARPNLAAFPDDRWSAFLAEFFVTLLVSVIAFLTFNLFDLRRDREVPVMGRFRQRTANGSETVSGLTAYDHQLFFRRRHDVIVAQTISVVIVVVLIGLFAWLLYDKWL